MFWLHKFDKHPSAIWMDGRCRSTPHTVQEHPTQAHSSGRHASESMSLDCHWTSVIEMDSALNARRGVHLDC